MQTKTCSILVVAVVLGLLIAARPSEAAEAELAVAVNSHYVWRGQVINDEPVLQPSLTVKSPCGLVFNTWANMDLTDSGLERDFSEADLTLAYGRDLGENVSLEAGIVQYVLKTEANTREAYVTASFNCILSPTLSIFYDFDEVDDVYARAEVSHSLDLVEKLTLDLGAAIGFGGKDYNDFYFSALPEEGEVGEAILADSAAFNDATVSAGLTYAFSDTLSLAGSVAYMALLDSDIEKGAEENFGEKDVVYGGITLTRSF